MGLRYGAAQRVLGAAFDAAWDTLQKLRCARFQRTICEPPHRNHQGSRDEWHTVAGWQL
jgi:hypothetical protein